MFHEKQETKEWCAKEFGIKPEEVYWYHSGTCYDRIAVTSEEAAKKVSAVVQSEGRRANGGMLDGMLLGGFNQVTDSEGVVYWDVYC